MHHHQFQLEKVRKVEGHRCTLPLEEEDVDIYVTGGVCVDFRRRLRHHLLISPKNPDTKSFMKSSVQIRAEEVRHLRHYYHMIHPFSQGRSVWETIMIMAYVGHFFFMPVESMLPPGKKPLLLYLKFVCDIASLLDVILFFFTGFYDFKASRVVMSQKKIAIRYVFTFFIFDLLGSLPYNVILLYTNAQETVFFRVKYLYLLRIIRLPTLMVYIRKFLMKMDVWSYKMTILHSSLYMIILIWWATWLSFLAHASVLGLPPDFFKGVSDMLILLMDYCYQIVREFMLVSVSRIYTNEALAIVFNIVALFFGTIFNMIVLSQVIQMYKRTSDAQHKYEHLAQEIGQYTKYKELPVPLKNKVFRYVEFKLQKNIFKESDIQVSKILKRDVVVHNCKKLVERVDFFKGLPSALISRIVTNLHSEIYLPNDVIVQAGVPGNAMYFIYMGTVAVYTSTKKEICHLEEGSHFGEISLLINEPRVASVIAVTDCEVFRLNRREFLKAMEPYPQWTNKIKKLALARLAMTKMFMNEDLRKHDEESD